MFLPRALRIATAAARLVGGRPDPLWDRIAVALYIPMVARGLHHLAFDPSVRRRTARTPVPALARSVDES